MVRLPFRRPMWAAVLLLAPIACAGGSDPAPVPPSSTATGIASQAAIPTASAEDTGPPPEPPGPPATADRFIGSVGFGPGGTVVLLCGAACISGEPGPKVGPMIHLWKPGEAAVTTLRFDEDGGHPLTARFSPGGATLITSHLQSPVRVLTPEGKLLQTIESPALYDNVFVSPDEKRILSASVFGDVRLHDRDTGRILRKGQSHHPAASVPVDVLWSPSGDRVVFVAESEAPVLWDGKTGRQIARLTVKDATFEGRSALVFLPDDGGLLVATLRGLIAVFDPATGRLREVLRKPRKEEGEAWEVAVSLSDDGKRLAVASTRGDMAWVDLPGKKVHEVFPADGNKARFPRWSPDGALLAFDRGDVLHVVRVGSNDPPARLGAGTVAGVGVDGTVVVMTEPPALVATLDGRERWRLRLPGERYDVSEGPGHRWLFVADGRLRLVRVTDGKSALFELQSRDGAISMAPVGMSAEDARALLAAP